MTWGLEEERPGSSLPSVSAVARQNSDPFRVLVATMISLRTKDEVTGRASAALLSLAATPAELAALPVADRPFNIPGRLLQHKGEKPPRRRADPAREARRPGPVRHGAAPGAPGRWAKDSEPRPQPRFRSPGDLRRYPRASHLQPHGMGGDAHPGTDRAGPDGCPAPALTGSGSTRSSCATARQSAPPFLRGAARALPLNGAPGLGVGRRDESDSGNHEENGACSLPAKAGKHMGGKWEFPGGKIDPVNHPNNPWHASWMKSWMCARASEASLLRLVRGGRGQPGAPCLPGRRIRRNAHAARARGAAMGAPGGSAIVRSCRLDRRVVEALFQLRTRARRPPGIGRLRRSTFPRRAAEETFLLLRLGLQRRFLECLAESESGHLCGRLGGDGDLLTGQRIPSRALDCPANRLRSFPTCDLPPTTCIPQLPAS